MTRRQSQVASSGQLERNGQRGFRFGSDRGSCFALSAPCDDLRRVLALMPIAILSDPLLEGFPVQPREEVGVGKLLVGVTINPARSLMAHGVEVLQDLLDGPILVRLIPLGIQL